MSLTTSRIRAVNTAFATGSFSEAARRLGVSQPAVSQQVRDLETLFGVTLFDRRGDSLRPTGLCRELVAVTGQIQDLEAEALAVLRRHEKLKSGELRVGLGNSMPGMAMISAFQGQYPGIRIDVEMGSWSSIIDAVVQQRVDVGVLPDVPDDGRFRREVSLRQGVVAITHPNHPMGLEPSLTCKRLINHRLVFRTRQSSTQRVVDRAFRAAGLTPRPAIVLDTRDGVFEAVANGLGIGFMWEHGSSRTDQIKKIHVPEMAAEIPEYVFCLAGKKEQLVDLFFAAPKVADARAVSQRDH